NNNSAIGRPGIRLNDFISLFGNRGLFRTVCQSDYSGALTDIGTLLFNSISPCLEGNIDMTDSDPNNPGLQPQCTVSDVQNAGSDETETLIPTCAMTDANTPATGGPRPCWGIKNNPAACSTDTGLGLHLERHSPPAVGTTARG